MELVIPFIFCFKLTIAKKNFLNTQSKQWGNISLNCLLSFHIYSQGRL